MAYVSSPYESLQDVEEVLSTLSSAIETLLSAKKKIAAPSIVSDLALDYNSEELETEVNDETYVYTGDTDNLVAKVKSSLSQIDKAIKDLTVLQKQFSEIGDFFDDPQY